MPRACAVFGCFARSGVNEKVVKSLTYNHQLGALGVRLRPLPSPAAPSVTP